MKAFEHKYIRILYILEEREDQNYLVEKEKPRLQGKLSIEHPNLHDFIQMFLSWTAYLSHFNIIQQ